MMEKAICEAVAQLCAEGEPYVVATVVRVSGSAYRRPGARMVIARDRWVAGSVSGGCLEGDLVKTAWWRAGAGEQPVVVRYDTTRDGDGDADGVIRAGFGIGCDGVVDVMIERPRDGALDPIALGEDCAREERRGAIATVFASRDPRVPVGARLSRVAGEAVAGDLLPGDVEAALVRELDLAIALGTPATVELDDLSVLVEALVPPPWLYVFGTGHDAVPVVALARSLGWRVAVCTPHPRLFARARFLDVDELVAGPPAVAVARLDRCDRALAVVMNHDYALDCACLGALLLSRTRYIGMLGPRARTTRLAAELGVALDHRVHAPVGLDLGADTPTEVALSIGAEVQSTLAGVTTGAELRGRRGPIHAPRSLIDDAIAAIAPVEITYDNEHAERVLDEVA